VTSKCASSHESNTIKHQEGSMSSAISTTWWAERQGCPTVRSDYNTVRPKNEGAWWQQVRERGFDAHYRSLFMWMSIPWSIVPAVVVSCATILDVAIALCNGKSDCAHAISPPNLFSYHTVIGIETSCPSSFILYLTLNPKLWTLVGIDRSWPHLYDCHKTNPLTILKLPFAQL
jgi:hypothetical protein